MLTRLLVKDIKKMKLLIENETLLTLYIFITQFLM